MLLLAKRRGLPQFQMRSSAPRMAVFLNGTVVTFAPRSRPVWRGPISNTGVPNDAASIIPEEELPTNTAASRNRPRYASRLRFRWTGTDGPFDSSSVRMIPADPGSLLG